MKLSINAKLGSMIGLLLGLFLVLGGTAYLGIRTIHQQVQQIVAVELPSSEAAYEMDVNTLRIVVGVLGYLQYRTPEQLDRIKRGEEGFEQFQQTYRQLANSAQENALRAEAERLFTQFDALAAALVRGDDEQRQKTAAFLESTEEWERLLDEQIKPTLKAEGDLRRAYQKLEIVMELDINRDDSHGVLGDYLRTHAPEYEKRLREIQNEFEPLFVAYAQLALSAQEQSWAEQLRRIFGQIKTNMDAIIALENQKIADLAQFINLRSDLGNTVLYEGMIKTTAAHLDRASVNAVGAMQNADRTILLLLALGLSVGLFFGVIFARKITRPLKQVVAAASRIAVGDLAVKLDLQSSDEIGLLTHSFRELIAYIRDVAAVAETISAGDLRVAVRPRSAQDVLNLSLQKMITYIHDVADVTERISNKDLAVAVQPQSDHDVLNQSLQRMVTNLQAMIQEIGQRNWLQNGLNQLSNELLGEAALREVCNKALRFAARYVNAGSGGLYVYDAAQAVVTLHSSFAFTARARVSNRYALGEGVVGQVALEKTPILLKHVRRADSVIQTGVATQPPLNTYTLPLIYDQELHGVLELAAFEPFDQAKQHFLNETSRIIATGIFSTKQREQVQELLRISQEAQQAAEQAAQEAERAQAEAQQQAVEVRKANTLLEEQQQQLRQQSERLRAANVNLQEQQYRLQQQSEELRQQNESLTLARAELDQRAQELELASKYKSEFLANMSHELRTPLNSIILLSKMLSRNDKGHLQEKEVKQASVIHQAGEELLRLINDILDLSKIESGKVTLNPTQFATTHLLESFRDLFHTMAEEKKLAFLIQDDLQSTLLTDKDKLSQVIRNLLSNAFKFTKKGSVTLRLRAHPARADLVQIAVMDTGIGIAKDKQQLVFEAFQQADGSTSREYGGTGLGLTISREYIKFLQGTIALTSEVGQGSNFTLTIPLALKDVAPVAALAPKAEPDAPRPSETARRVAPPLTPPEAAPIAPKEPLTATTEITDDREAITPADKVILVIEDNADLAQNTMDVTRAAGFKVLVALDGQTGLALAAKYRPTGILLDLVLPDMNGMEVLRELKSTRELRHIPVHIMSSKERDNTYRTAGAIGYFQKPLNDLDIQRAVENLLAVSAKHPKQLLIVEDNAAQREAMRKLMGDGAEVQLTSVASETEAIREIEKGGYDAAIIDLGLQNGSGQEICRYIREHNLALPIILYTDRELTEEEKRQLQKYTDRSVIKTAQSYERLSDEAAVFLHKMYHGDAPFDSPSTSSGQAAQGDRHGERSRTTRTLPHSSGSLAGKKILIVDDDVKNVFVLASALENNGATIVSAQNGQLALDVLRAQNDIAIVLMDIMMPVMDGYTAIRQIRKDPQLRHLPIIALTAKALKDDRQKCIQAGADDYLSKPVDYDGLIRLVKAWIEKG